MQTDQEWLDSDEHKIILVDVQYYDGSSVKLKHFSSHPFTMRWGEEYTTSLGTQESNIAYDDIIKSVPNITSKIEASTALGNVELYNTDGEYDGLLNISNVWEGYKVQVFIGGSNWWRSQFILIMEGVVDSLTAPTPQTISINIKDSNSLLNVPVQTNYVTNSHAQLMLNSATSFVNDVYYFDGTNHTYRAYDPTTLTLPDSSENLPIPILLGLAYNVEPVLIDIYNHVYQINDGPIGGVSEVRSNGVELTSKDDADVDTIISSVYNNAADITASLIGAGSSGNTVQCTNTGITSAYVGGIVNNTTVGEARRIIAVTDIDEVTVRNNSNGEDAETAGWSNNDTLEYWKVSTSPGLNVAQYEVDLDTGLLRLLVHDQSTRITCNAYSKLVNYRTPLAADPPNSGVYPYNLTALGVSNAIEWLILEKTTLTRSDLDHDTFDPGGTRGMSNQDSIGLYINSDTTVDSVVKELIGSVGGYFRFNRLSKAQIFQLVDPAYETSVLTIDEDHIVEDGLSLSATESPKNSIQLGYYKTWSLFDKSSLAGSILEDNITDNSFSTYNILTNEYRIIKKDNNIRSIYPLAIDDDMYPTLLTQKAQVETEASRRALLRKQKRYIFKAKCVASPFTLNVGDTVNIVHSRYGFNAGKQGLIIGMTEYPTDRRVDLEVWI